jgi:anthranilate/para-aminobenzoate synthase component I
MLSVGGVVHDGTAQDEYAEALLKSRFALLSDGLGL